MSKPLTEEQLKVLDNITSRALFEYLSGNDDRSVHAHTLICKSLGIEGDVSGIGYRVFGDNCSEFFLSFNEAVEKYREACGVKSSPAFLPAEKGKGVVKPLTPTPYELEIVEDGDCDADDMGGTVSWGTGEDVFSGCIGHRDMQAGDFEIVAENVKEQDAKFIVEACNRYSGQQSEEVKALIEAATLASQSFGVCACGLKSCSNCGSKSVPAKLRKALAHFSTEVRNDK